jgi:hypothetical protein
VKTIQQDNAGKNKLLQSRSDSASWKLGIAFEYTASNTPQQNHLAELAFATVINKARAMMAAAYVPLNVRYKLWKEAICTATDLDGLLLVTLNNKVATKYEHAFGKNPKFALHLQTWGEARAVKTKVTGTPKLADRGVICIFIGYTKDHDGDCYRMWDPITSGVHTTRDIIWLRRMFYTKNIGFDIVAEPDILKDTPPAQPAETTLAEAPVVLENLPTLMPGRDDADDVSEGDETVPTGNSEDPSHDYVPIARTS